jgi:hypothetical protein
VVVDGLHHCLRVDSIGMLTHLLTHFEDDTTFGSVVFCFLSRQVQVLVEQIVVLHLELCVFLLSGLILVALEHIEINRLHPWIISLRVLIAFN